MKIPILLISIIPFVLYAQNYPINCAYNPIRINDSTYHLKVNRYDSLINRQGSCLLNYLYFSYRKPDGTLVIFDDSNRKRWSAEYKNGVKIGKQFLWYATGELESEYFYREDIYYDYIFYLKDGKICSKIVNGNSDNEVKYYYSVDGILNKKIEFDSLLVHYSPDLIVKRIYKFKEFYNKGNLKLTGALIDETYKFGKWTYYDKNGKITKVQEYKEPDSVLYYPWDE